MSDKRVGWRLNEGTAMLAELINNSDLFSDIRSRLTEQSAWMVACELAAHFRPVMFAGKATVDECYSMWRDYTVEENKPTLEEILEEIKPDLINHQTDKGE